MSKKIRCYTELIRLSDHLSRFNYLSLRGTVGDSTFGFDRYLNQQFYRSKEWRDLRYHIIARDEGCDLGIPGLEIHERIYIHHMNPMVAEDIVEGNDAILDPEYLISVSHDTHNAIHYGDPSLLRQPYVERKRGDTKLW